MHMRKQLQQVDAVEQRYVVNSGVGGTKNNHLMIEMDFTYYLSYHIQTPSTGNLYYWDSRGLRRFGSSLRFLGPLRTRAGSTVHYAIQELV